jgi:hypothetical protein
MNRARPAAGTGQLQWSGIPLSSSGAVVASIGAMLGMPGTDIPGGTSSLHDSHRPRGERSAGTWSAIHSRGNAATDASFNSAVRRTVTSSQAGSRSMVSYSFREM